jgi:hypothetical protein
MSSFTDRVALLNGITTPFTSNSTSEGFDVSGRSNYSLQFIATGVISAAAGGATFEVDISNDNGTTWTAYNRLKSNATTDARVASVTLTTTPSTSKFVFIDHGEGMGMIRVKVGTPYTAGVYSAYLCTKD